MSRAFVLLCGRRRNKCIIALRIPYVRRNAKTERVAYKLVPYDTSQFAGGEAPRIDCPADKTSTTAVRQMAQDKHHTSHVSTCGLNTNASTSHTLEVKSEPASSHCTARAIVYIFFFGGSTPRFVCDRSQNGC